MPIKEIESQSLSDGVIFPMVRRIFSKLLAIDIVSVKPLNPSSNIKHHDETKKTH